MHQFHKLQLLTYLFTISISLPTSVATTFCGKIQIQSPFMTQNSSLTNNMILCKADKLYFRTSHGLFQISSIDYQTKLLTISHPNSCSSSLHYVSPSLLSAGFPSPPQPNSLLLFNCSNKRHQMFSFKHDCANFNDCGVSSCVVVDDVVKMDMGFHPKDLNCSHYSRVYRNSSQGYELGTRISFDLPDHVPNVCDECKKANGNCGVGLRCICYPTQCKDKVISKAGSNLASGIFNTLSIFFVVRMVTLMDF